MDIEKLKIFYQVAQNNSLTVSATMLDMDKSSISRKLKALEESLALTLFYKRGKKLTLTNKGEQLFNRLQGFFGELKNLELELSDPASVSGKFRISTTHAVASTWLSKFIHKFIDKHPNLNLSITASNEDLTTALQHHDIAIRPYVANAAGFEQEFLMRWRLQLFASKTYLNKFGTPTHPDDLYNHRIILFDDGAKLYTKTHTHWMLHMHTKFGRPRIPFMTVNSLQAMYELVRSGVGLGSFAMDSPMMTDDIFAPILKDQIFTNVDVFYIYPQIMKHDPLITSFAIFLKSEVASTMQVQD